MTDGLPLTGLEVRRTQDGGTLTLTLGGELDLASAASLENELADPLSDGFQHIVVDLSQLAFMDSRGLVTLARAQEAAQAERKAFSLRRGGRQIQQLFDLTGLSNLFTFLD